MTDHLEAGAAAFDRDDVVAAVRHWIRGADAGDEDCRHNLGVALSALGSGPAWARIGHALAEPAGPEEIGSAERPLLARARPQFSPFDVDTDMVIHDVDADGLAVAPRPGITFRGEVLVALDVIGWEIQPAGATALAGRWSGHGDSCIVLMTFSADAVDGWVCHVFAGLGVRLPLRATPPWTRPESELPMAALADSLAPSQSDLLAALLRLAEVPPEFDPPLPWVSYGPASWLQLADGTMTEFSAPLQQVTCGFDVRRTRDLEALPFSLGGAIQSLVNLHEWATEAFRESPAAWAEVLPLLPAGAVDAHRHLIGL